MSRQDKVSLARRAEQDGSVEDAERLYREAIEEGDSYGYNNLAQLLIEVGRMREVERLFRKGVNAGDPLAAKNLALFLLEEGREVAATETIRVARRLGRPPTEQELTDSRTYHRTQSSKRPLSSG